MPVMTFQHRQTLLKMMMTCPMTLTANPRKRGENRTKCGTETSIKTSVKAATPRPGYLPSYLPTYFSVRKIQSRSIARTTITRPLSKPVAVIARLNAINLGIKLIPEFCNIGEMHQPGSRIFGVGSKRIFCALEVFPHRVNAASVAISGNIPPPCVV